MNSRYITRPTSMGMALVAASAKAIVAQGGSIINPAVPWPARRVALTDGKTGMVSERTITYPKRSK